MTYSSKTAEIRFYNCINSFICPSVIKLLASLCNSTLFMVFKCSRYHPCSKYFNIKHMNDLNFKMVNAINFKNLYLVTVFY